jgi:hypothetical protein
MANRDEVDEVELQRNRNLRSLLEKVVAHPEARELLERAHKLVDPNAKTPALDAKKVVTEPIEQVRTELANFIKAQNEANEKRESEANRSAIKNKVESGMAALKAKGWTTEGLKAVEALMEEKGLLDPLDAADLYEKRNPPALPATPSGGSWNFPEIPKDGGDAYEKALLDSKGSNDLIAERQAMEVLNEIRGARRN